MERNERSSDKTYGAYLQIQRERVARPIKLLTYDMSEKSEVANVVFLSDVHYGDRFCEVQKFKRHIEAIAKMDNAVVVLNGDLINNATIDAPPSAYDDILRPDKTILDMAEMLEPIKDKIAVVASGNHELWSEKKTGIDPTLVLAKALGLEDKYASEMWVVDVKVKKSPDCKKDKIVIAGRHGSGGGKAAGAAINKVDEMVSAVKNADIYVVGHLHKPGMSVRDIESIEYIGGKPMAVQHPIYEISCSSYQSYNRFAAKHAMKPSSTENRVYQFWNGVNPEAKDIIYQGDIRKPKYKTFCNTLSFEQFKVREEDKNLYTEEEVKKMLEIAKQETKKECLESIAGAVGKMSTEQDLGPSR